MYIHRHLESTIIDAAKYFPVVTVTGPRQSGKTTMLRHLFADLPYYSMENLATRALAMNDPIGFLSQHPQGMILDEVQNVPQLLSYIQGIVDEHREVRFVLSGSANFSLLKNVTQSLAGRTAVYELMPLSYRELGDESYIADVDSLIFNGLYPAICTGSNKPELLYPAYIKTYLERDVRDLLAVRNLMQFEVFLRLCAGRIGSVLNASQLASEVGVTSKTITEWLSILQTSYVIHLLPPYYDNSRKRLTKQPKIYFCDTGLACALLNIESRKELAFHNMRGHLFENLIVMELLKRRLNQGKAPNLYFYRDSNQNEVDILAGSLLSMEAYEIKSAMTYNSSFEKTLCKVNEWIAPTITSRTIVYAGEEERTGTELNLLNFRHL